MTSKKDAASVNGRGERERRLVAVVVGLEGTVLGNVEVLGLFVGEDGQLDVKLFKVSTSDLLIQLLRQDVDAEGELLRSRPKGDLRDDLIGEGAGHDEGRVSSSASEVDETTIGKEDDVPARWHGEPVDLRLDVHDGRGILLQPSDVNLNVEVTDVGDDGVFDHDLEVLPGDDVPVTGGGDEDVGAGSGIVHGRDFETSHSSLESVDWVDLGDKNTSSVRPQSLSALESDHKNGLSFRRWELMTYTLSDITVASNDGDLSSKHDVGSTLNTIDKGLAASVVVVELALGDGVVDIDSSDLELALPVHTVKVVDTGGGLFRETPDPREELWVFLVNVGGEVTTIIENQVQRLATGEALDGLINTPDVFLLGLTLPGEDGDAGGGNGGCGVILGGEDVLKGGSGPGSTADTRRERKTYAGRPGNLGTESSEGLDQDGGLDGHVQASSDTSALERLGSGVLLPHVHETWHLMFGDFDLLATKGGKGDICVERDQRR